MAEGKDWALDLAKAIVAAHEQEAEEAKIHMEEAAHAAKLAEHVRASYEQASKLAGLLSIGACTELLRQYTGVPYSLHPAEGTDERQSPIYNAINRELLQTQEVQGQKFVTVESFVDYMAGFEPRQLEKEDASE